MEKLSLKQVETHTKLDKHTQVADYTQEDEHTPVDKHTQLDKNTQVDECTRVDEHMAEQPITVFSGNGWGIRGATCGCKAH